MPRPESAIDNRTPGEDIGPQVRPAETRTRIVPLTYDRIDTIVQEVCNELANLAFDRKDLRILPNLKIDLGRFVFGFLREQAHERLRNLSHSERLSAIFLSIESKSLLTEK